MGSQFENLVSHSSAVNLILSVSHGVLSDLKSCNLRPLSLLALAGPVNVTPAATPQGHRPLSLKR